MIDTRRLQVILLSTFFCANLLEPKLHRPGIAPGPPAWQASILPLNQRCCFGKCHLTFCWFIDYFRTSRDSCGISTKWVPMDVSSGWLDGLGVWFSHSFTFPCAIQLWCTEFISDASIASFRVLFPCSIGMTTWRNGSASDSRSEGCVFISCWGSKKIFFCIKWIFLQMLWHFQKITVGCALSTFFLWLN